MPRWVGWVVIGAVAGVGAVGAGLAEYEDWSRSVNVSPRPAHVTPIATPCSTVPTPTGCPATPPP